MPHLAKRCVSLLMALSDVDTYIQTFILVDKFSGLSAAREDIFALMKNNKVRTLFSPPACLTFFPHPESSVRK